MSQFDEKTERNAEKYCSPDGYLDPAYNRADFIAGRNSAKESLKIFARMAERECCCPGETNWTTGKPILCDICEAIAAVKALGDWPLEEKTK